jgi:hypothetical protein
MTVSTLPYCALENPEDRIYTFSNLRIQFQRTPYTKAAMIVSTDEHRSSPEPVDLENFLCLLAALPDRIGWLSSIRSGATQPHCHFQLHLRKHLGDTLPIEHSGRVPLLGAVGPVGIFTLEGYPVRGISVQSADDPNLLVQVSFACIRELHCPFNLVMPGAHEVIILGRTKEVPNGWSKKFGGGEVAGAIIFTQEPEGGLPQYDRIWNALADVGLPLREQKSWEERVVKRLSHPVANKKLLGGCSERPKTGERQLRRDDAARTSSLEGTL